MILNTHRPISILLPQKPTLREQFAAEELQKYLRAILGCAPAISDAEVRPEGACFLIGGPERNLHSAKYLTEAEFRAEAPGPEGMLLRALDENTVMLAGSSWHEGECERGTLYADRKSTRLNSSHVT